MVIESYPTELTAPSNGKLFNWKITSGSLVSRERSFIVYKSRPITMQLYCTFSDTDDLVNDPEGIAYQVDLDQMKHYAYTLDTDLHQIFI